MRTIVKIKFGSHLYGTSTPKSDLDFKSIVVPDGRELLLGKFPKTSYQNNTKADQNAKNTAEDVDHEAFTLQGWLRLLEEGQTVALEMLFAPESSIVYKTKEWDRIAKVARARLLHKSVKAFFGYARQQAAKYGLKGSRVSAIRKTLKFLSHHEDHDRLNDLDGGEEGYYSLPYFIQDCTNLKLDETEPLVKIVTIKNTSNDKNDQYLEVCNRKVPLTATVKTAREVYQKAFDEYGQRALQAEQNIGVDWKALSHAVRVGNQAVEFLETGWITLPRPEAAHLLSIKKGELTYAKVAEEIEGLLSSIDISYGFSTLPAKFDRELADDLIIMAHLAETERFAWRFLFYKLKKAFNLVFRGDK